MFYRQLGQTDLRLSALGLGTVKFGRNQAVKYPDSFELPSEREARTLLDLARDLGINFVDTAPAYGVSEERLGRLLRDDRKQWLIATKAGEEFVDGQSQYIFSPEHIRASVERSMKRLGTDYLDLVLIHSDGRDREIIEQDGALATLAELKQRGWIRATGMSTKTVDGGRLAVGQADCVMLTYNLREQTEREVLDYCTEQGKGALIKKALASGHLASGDSVAEAFAMIFAHPAATAAVVGTLNPVHLRDNVKQLPKLG